MFELSSFPPLIPGGEELLRRAVVPSRRAHGARGGRGGGRQEGGQGGDGARRQGHNAPGGRVSGWDINLKKYKEEYKGNCMCF